MVKYIITSVVMVAISVVGYIQSNHAFPAYSVIVDIVGVALQTIYGILDGKLVAKLKARLVKANLSPD